MKEAERMNRPPKAGVRDAIEARQDRWRPPAGRPAPATDEGYVTVFGPDRIRYLDGEGRERDIQPDPAFQHRLALQRAESDARAAFEAAVLDDFASTPQLYVRWWIAHLAAGGRGISPFGEAVQTVLMKHVNNR